MVHVYEGKCDKCGKLDLPFYVEVHKKEEGGSISEFWCLECVRGEYDD
jgi:hypothetical protein